MAILEALWWITRFIFRLLWVSLAIGVIVYVLIGYFYYVITGNIWHGF